MAECSTNKLNAWELFKQAFKQCFALPASVWAVASIGTWPITFCSVFDCDTWQLMMVGVLFFLLLGTFVDGFVFLTLAALERSGKPDILGSMQKGIAIFGWLLVLNVLLSVVIATGMLLLVVPGVILLCGLFVAMPACIYEGLSPFNSIKRSWKMTLGHRKDIFRAMLRIFVIIILVFGLGYGLLELITPGFIDAGGSASLPVAVALSFVALPLDVFCTVFLCIACKNIYDCLVRAGQVMRTENGSGRNIP